MSEPDIQLGDIAKDTVTGYEGIVIARTEWLNGCWRLILHKQGLTKDDKPHDPYTVDIEQLDLVSRATSRKQSNTGGPKADTFVTRR